MCARYEFSSPIPDEKMAELLRVMERKYPDEYKTGEILPGDAAPAIVARQEKIVPVPAVFGFPGFKDGRLLINARSETAAEKKTFADSLRTRRVILPATGFFEWDRAGAKYRFTADARSVMYLCGLYKVVDGRVRFVILTRSANESMIETHDRMPVIAKEDEVRPYLTDLRAAMTILAGAAPTLSRARAV
ncbi:MAG: SOS response-associated peptidase family protein [Oscillospiraceae bacterium]|nr:SOS response-associated peptidase family protein [Oscillospiraceae bacterium]